VAVLTHGAQERHLATQGEDVVSHVGRAAHDAPLPGHFHHRDGCLWRDSPDRPLNEAVQDEVAHHKHWVAGPVGYGHRHGAILPLAMDGSVICPYARDRPS
jgi:hypothetical protein